ncbi:glucosamine-6-phosphate deaminase [Serpentinicella sp. ANB-PHB4]|uniref:glucosamine-6-phosphate deaminase n=1 Tax=Serpentinicella sp. ANB-PHB4 TaxID=3074076 RepID=UPI00285B1471|nr:glucosamine-6-phosphate deaminase [Serpentinicella sp. ANB-PHB4]MDR5659833.1 glucosamine-6-phosphate deaminase [Serpentinicella sp. ANB-PHB4]
MQIEIVKDYEALSKKAANIIASQIVLKPQGVIGLATGSTPVGTYKELIRMNKEGLISFSNITSFNLDEYYGLGADDDQSYHYFMNENLFNAIDIKKENIHIPNGKASDVGAECTRYENRIKEAGGIDLQLLGIGQNGHIGFNEPNENFEPLTHLVNLDSDTIKANARFFDSIEEVPTQAISMGVKTILSSRKILLLASGENKAEAMYKMIKGKVTPKLPASALQLHHDVVVIMDEAAASLL